MSENFPGSMPAEEPKPAAPSFETSADGLSGETKERYIVLGEQVEALKKRDGGMIIDANLTSAERLQIDEYNELRALAFRNIGQAE
jgi:hypothetical protein